MYILVTEGVVSGAPFELPESYQLPDGSVILGFRRLSDQERIDMVGVYPVVDNTVVDPRYQTKTTAVYTLNGNQVDVSYTVVDKPLPTFQQERIAEVYVQCKSIMDVQTLGYTLAEIATWPALHAEIVAYNADNNNVGPNMQAIIDRGRHTAATLSALLTPKIAVQAQSLQTRDDHVSAILLLGTLQDIADYDISNGWPA